MTPEQRDEFKRRRLAYLAKAEKQRRAAAKLKAQREAEAAAEAGVSMEWVERSRAAWRGPTLDLVRLAVILRDEHVRGAARALEHAWPGADVREGVTYEELAAAVLEQVEPR
jgi:hypothetical protein